MILRVGSKNQVKVRALREIVECYPFLAGAEIVPAEVSTEVSEQPRTLEETIKGAKARARNAFFECDLSFGMEDGLMEVPDADCGIMNVCVCAAFDGMSYSVGFSSAFEYPKEITELVVNQGMNVSRALCELGLCDDPDIGSKEGAVGILSKGRLLRKAYTEQAVVTSIIRLMQKQHRPQRDSSSMPSE